MRRARCHFRTVLTLLVTLAAQSASAGSLPFVFAGRLVQKNGQPTEGRVDLAVSFFRTATGGAPVLPEPFWS